jgi:hypothetical protein
MAGGRLVSSGVNECNGEVTTIDVDPWFMTTSTPSMGGLLVPLEYLSEWHVEDLGDAERSL